MSAIATYKGYTLTEARAKLQLWKEAEDAAATGKAYTLGSRQLARQDLPLIEREIAKFAGIVEALSGGQAGPVRVYERKSRW